MMTAEERQVRAWIRTVLRHAAMRWFVDQHRQHSPDLVFEPGEEEEILWVRDPHPTDSDIAASVWLAHCSMQLTLRDQAILRAINQGWTQREIAQALHCTGRTVRRAIRRIRSRCPYS